MHPNGNQGGGCGCQCFSGRGKVELAGALSAIWTSFETICTHSKHGPLRMAVPSPTDRSLTFPVQVAMARVGRVRAAAALAVWRARSAYWQAKAARWARAVSWHRRRALERLLKGWCGEAARLAAKAAARLAAELHRRRAVLARVLRLWRRYAWCVGASNGPRGLGSSAMFSS